MATKKDLVEAHAFSRRRLVTAFVSGAPGGREVEPPRPMRAVLGGLALSVLLLAGGAVAGLLAPQTDPDWLRDGNLVASRTGGDLYLVRAVDGEPTLRPFTNAMSARLLLGEKETVKATAADIADQEIGPQIGIADPPAQVAPRARLVQSGWTACTRDGAGISLDVAADPSGDVVPGGAQVVSVDGRSYLVTDEGRSPTSVEPDLVAAFPVAPRRVDQLLDQLRLTAAPVPVDRAWLSLVAQGDALAVSSFDVGRPGPVSYAAASGAPRLRSGQLATLSGLSYLVTETGLAQLSPFAKSVWVGLGQDATELPVTNVPQVRTDAFPSTWPTGGVVPAQGNACLRLRTGPDEAATVRVVSDPGSSARLEGVAAGRVQPTVQPGYGALVRSGTFASSRGSGTFLVNADGKSYALVDPSGATAANLGYAGLEAPVVPDAWLRLLPAGAELSADLAGQSPRAPAEASAP